MKKLIAIIIVLLLALIPILSHAQQGSGEHPQLGQFDASVVNKSIRIEYGSKLVIITGKEIVIRKNHYIFNGKETEHILISYYGEHFCSIVNGEAQLFFTPWVEITPQKASH